MHQDVLKSLSLPPGGGRLFFLFLEDPIVKCRVRGVVQNRESPHPLCQSIMSILQETGSLNLEELADGIGASGVYGLRFTSEILSRLVQCGWLKRLEKKGEIRFYTSRSFHSRNKAEFLTVLRDLYFVPRAGRLSLERMRSSKNCHGYRLPDEKSVYGRDSILRGLRERAYDIGIDVLGKLESARIGNEFLERSGLFNRSPVLSGLDLVDKPEILRGCAFFRCYFVIDHRGNMAARHVYGLRPFQKEKGYTRYLNDPARDRELDDMLRKYAVEVSL